MLLAIARGAIAARLEGRDRRPAPAGSPRLWRVQAAFVTLRHRGDLRGCIGTLHATRPLAETVADCAVASATEDPRFPPLERRLLDAVRIEISALGPLTLVRDPSAIVVGRHGVVVSRGPRRGLLLPQVALEEGWDLQVFLAHACLKAGLRPEGWREGARLEIFEAEVFAEDERPAQ
jgi:AmmeMemoRadiSam system protein A